MQFRPSDALVLGLCLVVFLWAMLPEVLDAASDTPPPHEQRQSHGLAPEHAAERDSSAALPGGLPSLALPPARAWVALVIEAWQGEGLTFEQCAVNRLIYVISLLAVVVALGILLPSDTPGRERDNGGAWCAQYLGKDPHGRELYGPTASKDGVPGAVVREGGGAEDRHPSKGPCSHSSERAAAVTQMY